MKRFRSILVALDTQLTAHPLVELAARVAGTHDAQIMLVDALPSLSWTSRLTGEVDSLREGTRKAMTADLEAIASMIRASGLDVRVKLLEGTAWHAIVEEADEGAHDLVMAVSKGKGSQLRGPFGKTARQLIRRCQVPVWLVPPDASESPTHIVACVDTSSDGVDSELNERIYRLATSISGHSGARLSILHAWEMADEAVLSARFPNKTLARLRVKERDYRRDRLDRFLRPHGASVDDNDVHLVHTDPATAVARFCRTEDVDLVVMGTVARSGLLGVLIGNTAESVLDQIETPVITVRPHEAS